ncbi:MAG: hypothetical protein KDC67_04200 [Ignavibacteriae bacterium]|nr:hypothetical protein [Ignavibacteriota bacterium]
MLKSKPESVANPQTIGQISQRNRFTLMVLIYRTLAGLIAIGFASRAIAKSAYNAFMSSNTVPATSVDGSGNASLVYANLSISKGTIGQQPITNSDETAGQTTAGIEWDAQTVPVGSNSQDVAFGAVYNQTQDAWFTGSGSVRDNESLAITCDSLVSGDVLHYYLFFKAFDGSETSDSAYFTTIVA